jgi:hypothetical protein
MKKFFLFVVSIIMFVSLFNSTFAYQVSQDLGNNWTFNFSSLKLNQPQSNTSLLYNAQSCTWVGINTFKDLIVQMVIGCVFSNLIRLMVIADVIVIIWGIFQSIRAEGDKKAEARQIMIWGIVGLFVLVSIGGLLMILQTTFQTTGDFNIKPREVNVNVQSLNTK